jgi:hypothetical protein
MNQMINIHCINSHNGFHIQKQIINITHIKNQWILHMQTHISSKMQS